MKRAKNDPGINIGDKIILRHIIRDESGVHSVDEDEKPHTVTKINSRSIYTELKTGESGKNWRRKIWQNCGLKKRETFGL